MGFRPTLSGTEDAGAQARSWENGYHLVGGSVEAKGFLQEVGGAVSHDFVKNRSLLSFEEYVNLFAADPRGQVRNAAQYLLGGSLQAQVEASVNIRHPAPFVILNASLDLFTRQIEIILRLGELTLTGIEIQR